MTNQTYDRNALAGKAAIVTGAGQGVGRGIALALGRTGASVLLAGRTERKVLDVCAEMRALGLKADAIRCDVTDRADIAATVAKAVELYGTVDILINNAAAVEGDMAALKTVEDTPEEYFRMVHDTNTVAPLLFMQAVFPHMKAHGGKILNFGSGLATEGFPGMVSYVASKEAVRGITRVAAKEWGRYKINVNVICPYALSPALAAIREENPEQFKEWVSHVPLGYAGDCEDDIGPVALFLCSEAGRFITGHTIMVDGGMMVLR